MTKQLRLKGSRVRIKRRFPETINYKIIETNSSFHVKCGTTGKVSVFQEFFASINKNFILVGRLGTRTSFYEV